jgi:FixJ family two-component response regulator
MNVQGCTIAVTNDDLRVLESPANLLVSFGYEAHSSRTAEQFLESDVLSRTCRIVGDVQLRQISGFGLLRFLKRSNFAIPVIIITGDPSERTAAIHLENGAACCFKRSLWVAMLLLTC